MGFWASIYKNLKEVIEVTAKINVAASFNRVWGVFVDIWIYMLILLPMWNLRIIVFGSLDDNAWFGYMATIRKCNSVQKWRLRRLAQFDQSDYLLNISASMGVYFHQKLSESYGVVVYDFLDGVPCFLYLFETGITKEQLGIESMRLTLNSE